MIFSYDLCLEIIIFEFVRRCLEYLISLYSSCTLLLNYTRCQYCMNHLIYISPILFHEINMMVNKHIFYIFYCSLRLNNKPPTGLAAIVASISNRKSGTSLIYFLPFFKHKYFKRFFSRSTTLGIKGNSTLTLSCTFTSTPSSLMIRLNSSI